MMEPPFRSHPTLLVIEALFLPQLQADTRRRYARSSVKACCAPSGSQLRQGRRQWACSTALSFFDAFNTCAQATAQPGPAISLLPGRARLPAW